jgi:MFS family permease
MLIVITLVQAIGFILSVVTREMIPFFVAVFVVGITKLGPWVHAQPIVYEYAPVERRPTYIGLASTIFGLATMITPMLGGVIAESSGGYPVVFIVSAVLSLISFILYIIFVKEPPRYEKKIEASTQQV